MNSLMQDPRYGLRVLRANPAFTITAALCVALGIGATTAIFSVVNAVILRPLPYQKPEQLVRLYTEFPTFPNGGLKRFWTSPPEFADLKRDLHSWQYLDAWNTTGANLAGGGSGEPMRVTITAVTGGLLEATGVTPVLGRWINMKDDERGAPQVAVISNGLWQRAYGGDRGIVGRQVQLNGRACTVIGVMPAGFQFPPGDLDASELWTPLQLGPPDQNRRGNHFLYLVGRLKDGVTFERARHELTRYVQVSGEKASAKTHDFTPKDHPLVAYQMHDEVVSPIKRAVLMLLGAVAFVLLIACVNVANLLLARAESRQREMAVRVAIGAGTRRLVRQFITEGVLLSGLGAVLGLGLAFGGLRVLIAAGQQSIPRASEIGLDRTVLLVTLALTLGTGIFFGLAPLVQLKRRNLHDSLKSASGRTTGSTGAAQFRRGLVVLELALALVLLIGNGLMVRAFWKLLSVNAGFDPNHVLTMRIALPGTIYPDSKATVGFWMRLEQRLRSLPGVTSSAITGGLPPSRPIDANDTQIENFVPRPGGPIQNIDYWQFVGNQYFQAMGIRLLDGRLFDERDGPGSNPVVIINKTFAQIYWPGQNALGRRVRASFDGPWFSIVGIVVDAKNAGLDKPAGTELYFSATQLAGGSFSPNTVFAVIKTKGDPMAMAQAARAEVRALDPALPVSAVQSMEQVMESAQARPRFLTLLLSLFSFTALTLAAVGIYGVISYSVARRTNEFGIRMAMGAKPNDLLNLVIGQGLILGVVGVIAGIAGAAVLTRFLQELLFGVSALDPSTFALMAVVLLAVTVVACWAPARRATRVDPMVALRYE
jgi:predicted permease